MKDKMENKDYKDMNLKELWQEITTLIDATNFADCDKDLFMKLIEEYGFRCREKPKKIDLNT